jgi:hypothetical protein
MIRTFRTPERTGWWPSQNARLSLSHYRGNYFIHIEIRDVAIRYRVYNCKNNKLVLDMVIRNNGESYQL